MLFSYLKGFVMTVMILSTIFIFKENTDAKINVAKVRSLPQEEKSLSTEKKCGNSYMSCLSDDDDTHVSQFVSIGKSISMSVYLVNGETKTFLLDTVCLDSLVFVFDKRKLKTKNSKFKATVKIFDCSLNIDCIKTIQITRKDFYDF